MATASKQSIDASTDDYSIEELTEKYDIPSCPVCGGFIGHGRTPDYEWECYDCDYWADDADIKALVLNLH